VSASFKPNCIKLLAKKVTTKSRLITIGHGYRLYLQLASVIPSKSPLDKHLAEKILPAVLTYLLI
jgi:hypothetical protein